MVTFSQDGRGKMIRLRRRKLPDPSERGNAGSFFKNPVVEADQADRLRTDHPELPAWPADWDVDFKLHLEKGAVISGSVTGGKLTEWNITPTGRKQDVVVHEPQKAPERPLIPANDYSVRIGLDQSGGSRFQGSRLVGRGD